MRLTKTSASNYQISTGNYR